MTQKGKAGHKLDKGQSLYNPDLIARVKEIILEIQPLKSNGTLHFTKIAKVMGIAQRTFSSWRNTESIYYKPQFNQALCDAFEELVERIASGKIKQAMIERAQPYVRIKKTKELRTVGPVMPAMSKMKKAFLQEYAETLGIKIENKWTVDVLKRKISEEVEIQTTEKLVIVKQEEERVHGDVAAAKLVLPNIGPKEKRWEDKSKVEVEGQSLADIAAIMSGKTDK